MDDEARLEHWTERTDTHQEHCLQWLEQALQIHDVGALIQFFSQQGFKLGQMAEAVHLKVFKAYLKGETSLDHVRAFFTQLGGGFFTNQMKSMSVWDEIAWLETKAFQTQPATISEFLERFQRMHALVRCLVEELEMPVNPQRTFGYAEHTRARPLGVARAHSAWMLYYVMAVYCQQHDVSVKQITLDELQRDAHTTPQILHFWHEAGLLTDNRGPIDHDVDVLSARMSDAHLHRHF
jgi:hypothetical protein